MTLDEFFESLPKDGWRVTPGGTIRRGPDECRECPVTAVANAREGYALFRVYEMELAAMALDATFPARHVAYAADGVMSHCELRRRLLETLGLEEPE